MCSPELTLEHDDSSKFISALSNIPKCFRVIQINLIVFGLIMADMVSV